MTTKTVAIYGYASSTRDLIWQSKADEIWSFNWAWRYDIPRIDRLFDMHPRWHLTQKGDQMEDHWAWLQEEHEFPIYMIEPFPEVPACVMYPLGDVLENVGRKYFTSSVAYAIGMALFEQFDRIELYGIDMATSTEYAYQKACTEYLIGLAEGRGIDVYIPDNSKLLRSGLYAYDGGFQVISRQTLEKIRGEYQAQFDSNLRLFQNAEGAWQTLKQQMEEEEDEIRKRELTEKARNAYQQFVTAKDNVAACDIAIQVMTHMIDHVDVKAPDMTIHNNMTVKV